MYLFCDITISLMSSNNLEKPSQPSMIQTLSAIIVAAIGWGSGNVISRSLLIDGINEIYLITIRVVVIGTILSVYFLLFIREKFEMTIFKEASLTSIFSLFAVSWFFIFALQYISSGLVTLLISSAPVFTAIWLKILLKEENISKTRYISIFVGLIGVLYLFLTKETGLLDQGNIVIGGTLAFLGVQCIALATVLNRKYAPKYKVLTWLTYQYPTVIFLTISAFLIFDIQIETLSISQITRITYLILANLSAFTSFTWLIRRVSALQVASVDYLVPIIGVSAGVIFLGESFNFNIVIAGVFIFISLIINTKEEFLN